MLDTPLHWSALYSTQHWYYELKASASTIEDPLRYEEEGKWFRLIKQIGNSFNFDSSLLCTVRSRNQYCWQYNLGDHHGRVIKGRKTREDDGRTRVGDYKGGNISLYILERK